MNDEDDKVTLELTYGHTKLLNALLIKVMGRVGWSCDGPELSKEQWKHLGTVYDELQKKFLMIENQLFEMFHFQACMGIKSAEHLDREAEQESRKVIVIVEMSVPGAIVLRTFLDIWIPINPCEFHKDVIPLLVECHKFLEKTLLEKI